MRSLFVAMCLSTIPAMAADIYTFTVPPGENVSASAGVNITGWGYSIHNESSSLWLVTTDLSAGTFQHATPTTPLIFDFPDLAPGATVTVPYNPLTQAGLYQIVWDTNVPPGFVNSGSFNLSAQWWNGDPLNGGSLVSQAPTESAPYSASLTPVPEPATIGLVGLVLFSILMVLSMEGPICCLCSYSDRTEQHQ